MHGLPTILWPEILQAVHWQSGLVTYINATSDLSFDMGLDGEIFQVLWGCSGLWPVARGGILGCVTWKSLPLRNVILLV